MWAEGLHCPKTRRHEFPADWAFASKGYTHNLDELLKFAHLDAQLDRDMKTRPELATNWGVIKGWNIDSRYESSGLNGKDVVAALNRQMDCWNGSNCIGKERLRHRSTGLGCTEPRVYSSDLAGVELRATT